MTNPPASDEVSASSGSIVGGASALAGSRYLQAVINWSGTILIIRNLSEGEWGRVAFVFALLGMIGLLSDLRVGRIVLRSVLDGAPGAQESAGSYIVFRALIGAASYVGAMAFVVLGGYPSDVISATAIAGVVLFLSSCTSAVDLLFYARMRMGIVATISVGGNLVQLGTIVALVATGRTTVVWFVIPAVLAAAVNLVFKGVAARALYRLTVAPSAWRSWMSEAAPLTLGGLLTAAYMGIDTLMLSRMDTFGAVGSYGIGYKFADIVATFPIAVTAPTFTVLVQSWPDDMHRVREVFRQSFAILIVVGVGTAFGFAVFAEPITTLLYGSRYAGAASAARLLVIAKALHFLSVLFLTMLTAAGRHRLYPMAALLGVVLNVTLNVVLIPAHSFRGAAVAMIITEASVLLVLARGALSVEGVRPIPVVLVLKTLVAAGVLVVTSFAAWQVLPWIAAALVGGIAYLGSVHLTRVTGSRGLAALIRPDVAEPSS
jgi:O-antigen/teichoic acid export membrane protein